MSNPKPHTDRDAGGLLDRLRAARRRLDLLRGMTGAAWAALAAAVVVALARAAALVGIVSAGPPGSAGGEWRWAAAILAAGLGVTALWMWRTRPDLLEMARRADRHFHLDERMSTTVELAGRPSDGDSPVVAALFRDAAGHVARVDPRSLIPIGVPRPAMAVVAVAAVVLGMDLAGPAGR